VAPVFFAFFAAYGAFFPFLPVHYQMIGLSPGQISLLQAMVPLLVFISQPIFGPLADRSGHRGRLLAVILALVGALGALVGLPRTFAAVLPVVALFSFFQGVVVPLSDSIALGEAQRTGVEYPRLRLWGSIGFLVASNLFGFLYGWAGQGWSFILWPALMGIAALLALRLPADGVKASRQPIGPSLKRLLARRELLLFLGVVGLVQMTQAAHATFFSIRLGSLGGTSGMVGVAWGLGALTEVPVWTFLPQFVRRWGPLPLLVIASVSFGVRWILYGLVASPALLVGLQVLQAISFALFMPVAVEEVGRRTPPDLRSSGQALLGIVSGGLATVLGTLLGGLVVQAAGTGQLYLWMGGVSFVAAVGFLALMRGARHTTGEPIQW
jgi:PPP family 3-phenylpropionic acid transporter